MWLKIHKQSERESYSHQKAHEGDNIATKTKIIEIKILAAVQDPDIDCDEYLNLLINIYPSFQPAQYK